jgi:hypothetical protein
VIARVIRGRGFGGTVRYCQQKAVGGRPLASSIHSEDPNGPSEAEVIYQLRCVASARDAARPVVHIPIRTRDDEHLSEEQWLAVAERVRIEMGFENCPWAAYLHNNEDGRAGQHLHLVLSRVSFDGKIVSDRNDRFRIMEVMRGLELELGLEPVRSGERSRSRAYPHDAEGRATDRELIMLRAQIDAAGANARTVRGFVERLEAAGVRAHLKVSRNGHLQGASFQLGESDRIWKGSDLGRAYSIARLVERFDLAQEGEVLQAYELRPREVHRLRSLGLAPDRVESSSSGRLTVGWVLIGTPREQALYQQWIQAALPGRLCDRTGGGEDSAWSRDVSASVLENRRQQIEAVVAGRRPSMPEAVPLLSEGPQGLRDAGRHVEALLERYAGELRSGESAERLSATWLEILRWTGVRGVRPEALERRGLGQLLAGLGSVAQTQNAIRSRLLRGERGYVSAPAVRGEVTTFPPHLLAARRGPHHREFNRRANQIVGERESLALLRVADRLGRSREDRRLRERLEARLAEVERAAVSWGGRRSGRAVRPLEKAKNAEAARRSVSRTLGGRLRQAERGLARGLVHTGTSLVPRPRLPGLHLLAKTNAMVATANEVVGWTREIGQAVLVIEAAVRREQGLASRRGASHFEQVASGDVSTYRLLRLTSGHPKAVACFEAPVGPPRDLPSAIREYRRSRAELIHFARSSLREGRPMREAAARAAQRAARVLAARERVVNAALQTLRIPSLRMLAGTARDRTEVLARFAHGCRMAGMSVGTVARVVAEVGPVVLGGVLAGAAVTLASRLVIRQVFGLGRELAKEFLYGERDRGR